MSTSTVTPALSQRPRWIVSAWWDLTYIVVTPLLIVPVVLILAQNWLTPEQVSLGVIAFASLGHHLPGFMRAYGDRELFQRYRWRFLLVPVMIFCLALLFSPPKSLAQMLAVPWTHLHGLELILLIWGTWHGLMQTYGFMRIYDVRQGVNDRWTARLDHWLCLSVFVAGVVFSDARVFGIAETMWQSGLPLFGPELVTWIRWLVGGVGCTVLVAYVANLVRLRRQGLPFSGLKLLLIGTTGWFYWYTGRLSTNMLIGLAMFEIYHAVQYYAIVWIYNRRLFKRAGERFGPLGFLFRDRWSMLGTYLAAIAAYSSIRFFTVDANAYVFRGGSQEAYQWLVAFFVTSSFLHFYFDGFIWKVSEKKTQQNLVEELVSNTTAERYVPAFLHAGKLALLMVIAGSLLFAEYRQSSNYYQLEHTRVQALAKLTPNLPECQSLLSRDALEHGNAHAAIQHAKQALALRPRSHALHADLGLAYLMARDFDAAESSLRRALSMAPDQWEYHCDLGLTLARKKQIESAEHSLREAIALRPDMLKPREYLVDFYLDQGRDSEADVECQEITKRFPSSLNGEIGKVQLLTQQGDFEQAIQLANFLSISNPNNWRVQFVHGAALLNSGKAEEAILSLRKASRQRRQSAVVQFHLGAAYLASRLYEEAVDPLLAAVKINPAYFDAQLQLANTYFALGDADNAMAAYARCQEMQPQHPEFCAKFGGFLAVLGKTETAEHVYRTGLEANNNSAVLHYNLGVLLWQKNERAEARQLISKAKELGMELSTEVQAAIGVESN